MAETFAQSLGIELAPRSSRPRTVGTTMVIDLARPTAVVESALAAYGEYVDLVKLVDLHLSWPADEVRRKIDIYRAHGVLVEPGGVILEIGRAQRTGIDAQTDLLRDLAALGFNAVEVSATTGARDATAERELVPVAQDLGFTVYGEVGQKFHERDGTLRGLGEIDYGATVAEMELLIELGCAHVLWEGHVLRHVTGTSPADIVVREDRALEQILPVVEKIGVDKLMFEVSSLVPFESRRALQFWFVEQFGPEVNIANVQLDEVPFLEHVRRGTWPIFGLGLRGDHPWIHALHEGRTDGPWWRAVRDEQLAARTAPGKE